MKKLLPLLSLLLLSASTLASPPAMAENATDRAQEALSAYVNREDSSYKWVKRREGALGKGRFVELILTSQTWQDIVWKHQLFIIKPSTLDSDAEQAMLFITGGRWRDELEQPAADLQLPREAQLFAVLAEQIRAPVAVLLHVPQQPIFDGKVEDQIIAYTFKQFLESKDTQWPLLLPMVKSAVRGMDAVQEFTQQAWDLNLKSFSVTGASKRGWTTWLTGAVDSRAAAIAPMVIDMLNMVPQMDHQRATFGDYSQEIDDYTELGLQQQLQTPAGKLLQAIVDPYSYRRVLTQPKLIILGTNDPYWPLDALNLYWKDLLGPKYILYVPNNPHGLHDYERLTGSLAALHESSAGKRRLPKLDWKLQQQNGKLALSLRSDQAPQQARAWIASAATRDFRQATWQPRLMSEENGAYEYAVEIPKQGYVALFGEAVFAGTELPFFLSTNVEIAGKDADEQQP